MTPHTRTTRRVLLALALAAACAPAARAADDAWVVRPVRLGTGSTSIENVDVLPTDVGVTLGYTLPGDLNLYLSTLPAGQPFFQHQTSSSPVYAATFAADPAGNIYFAGGAASSGIRVGTDAAGWGLGIVSGLHPTTSLGPRTATPAIAVDSHGIPAFVATDINNQAVLSRFDPPSGSWHNQTLPSPIASGNPYFQNALAYTPDDRAVVAYFTSSYSSSHPLCVAVQTDSSNWRTFTSFATPIISTSYGLSVATAPDGRIGVAYSSSSAVYLATYDGSSWSTQRLSYPAATLEPHSLTVDPDGHFALAYAPQSPLYRPTPLHLARQSSDGTWTDQTLPLSAMWASVAFDPAGHPYVGAFDGTNVLLAGTAIQTLLPNDFTLDNAVTAADIPAFAQAVLHASTYLANHAPLTTTADLVSIGDHNADLRLTPADARAFIESLSASPVPGLPDRNAGYLSFDQADHDPAVGSGAGNFFSTTLSTGRPYAPGDSRADLVGPTVGGAPDARIDATDVNYLHASLLLTPASTDPRLDLNGDGTINAADLRTLVHDILGTTEGDANLDGQINADDFALVDRGFALHLSDWSDGDFNLDGSVTPDDYLLLDTAYAQSHPLTPAFFSLRQSEFGDAYVSALIASVPEPTTPLLLLATLPLLPRRRRRS